MTTDTAAHDPQPKEPEAPDEKIDWTNPDAVAANLNAEEGGEAAPAADPKPEAGDEPSAKEPEKADSKPEAEPKDVNRRPEGVISKDGQYVLPYWVLGKQRDEARHLKEALEASEQNAAALKAELDKARQAMPGAAAGGDAPDWDALEADYPPELLKPMKDIYAELKLERAETAELKSKVEAEAQQRVQEQHDAELAAYYADLKQVPYLHWLNENGGARHDQAKAISERLANERASDPEAKPQTRLEHFREVEQEIRKVVEQENRLLGLPPPELPGSPPKSDSNSSPDNPQKPTRELPPKEPPAPTSVSDFQGGQPPATSEAESFAEMDGLKGAAILAKMTPKQQEEWLARTYR